MLVAEAPWSSAIVSNAASASRVWSMMS